jgi:hypothetical protein
MIALKRTIIDVKECHINRFPLIEQFPGKTTGPSKCPPCSMPQPAIVPLVYGIIILLQIAF